MHRDYTDIRSRIDSEPLWFDEEAVPRYEVFQPGMQADIYADELVLMEIACQSCGTKFLVCVSDSVFRRIEGNAMRQREPTEESMENNRLARTGDELHYGDPPNIGCCPSGPTMNCVDLRVLEYWRKDGFDWKRDTTYEKEFVDYETAFA